VIRESASVVLVGAGDLGRDALSVFHGSERGDGPEVMRVLGFVDERPELAGTQIFDVPVLGGLDWFATMPPGVRALVTVGDPAARRHLAARLGEMDVRFARAVHPSVSATPWLTLGEGSLVMAGTSLTVNVTVGRHVVINPGCTVAHDVEIGDFSYLSPGVDLAGRVVLEEDAYLGTGAVVIPGRRVGRGAVVGAGAVVIEDVPPGVTVAGVPARILGGS
jgi:sugar O-acyltransferase (sialic acid O-acetyltransferase NeuD family)